MHALASLLLAAAIAAPAAATDSAFTLHLDQPDYAPFENALLSVSGQPGQLGFLLFDTDTTPTTVLPGLTVDIGFSYNYFVLPVTLPASGTLDLPYSYDCTRLAFWTGLGGMVHTQAVSIDPSDASLYVSNQVTLDVTSQYGYCQPCAPCDGAINHMTMRYLGASPMYVEVTQQQGASNPVIFGATVQPFETFSFQGTGPHGIMTPEIQLYLDGQLDIKIHTSCSVPIGPGQEWGSFRILEAISQDGGNTCPEAGGSSS